VTITASAVSLNVEDAAASAAFLTSHWREEPGGERAFRVTGPNGVIVRLADWNGPAGT
jgi:hypothetical protein